MDIFENRRLRLACLVREQCGGRISECARRINRHQSYVSRLLYPAGKKGKRNIADELIGAIESAFKLPHGWLDFSTEGYSSVSEVAALFRDLPDAKKDLALAILRVMADNTTPQSAYGSGQESEQTKKIPGAKAAASRIYPALIDAERRVQRIQVEHERRKEPAHA